MGALLSAVRFLVLLWLFLSRPHRSHALLGSEEFHPLCKQPSVGQALMGTPSVPVTVPSRPVSRLTNHQQRTSSSPSSAQRGHRAPPRPREESRGTCQARLMRSPLSEVSVLRCPPVPGNVRLGRFLRACGCLRQEGKASAAGPWQKRRS